MTLGPWTSVLRHEVAQQVHGRDEAGELAGLVTTVDLLRYFVAQY